MPGFLRERAIIDARDTVDPAHAEGEVSDTDARLWHPWLRINRVRRVMLHRRIRRP